MIRDGYQALREAAAVFSLPDRGLLRATGQDRVRFLHAMSTAHLQELVPNRLRYTFFLDAQGRILADARVLCFEDSLLLDTEPETRDSLRRHLDKYIIADDVTLADESAQRASIALEGPNTSGILAALGFDAPPRPDHFIPWRGGIIARFSATGANGVRFQVPAGDRQTTIDWLLGLGAIEATAAEVRAVRLENARPRYGEDIDERTLVQETQLMHAVSFTKGCYLGQEIVERVRSRGHVNRLLVQLALDTESPPPARTPLAYQGKEAGHITSAVFSPGLGKVIALGYVSAAVVATKPVLDAAGVAASLTGKSPV
jgi:folate-binding protein YgfZ